MAGRAPWWLVGGVAGCGGVLCDLGDQADDIAGPDAVACGADWTCAAEHLDAGEPFTVVWEETGADSRLERGVAFDGATVFLLSTEGGEISGHECVGPRIGGSDTGGAGGDLRCAELLPEANHYRVCGHDLGQHPAPLPFPGR